MAEDRVALYVRIPSVQARRLDARARSCHRAKQDLVTDLIADCLDQLRPVPGAPPVPRGAGASTGPPDAGRVSILDDEVMTLAEVAALLRLDEATVLERAAIGDLPGRRFGLQWRFSRRAVFAWLDGSDGFRPGPGFRNHD